MVDIHIRKELIDNVCQLNFQADCHTIKLIDPQKINNTILEGFGWIKIEKDRVLHFKMYITNDITIVDNEGKSVWYDFDRYDKYKDENDLFNFIAEDVDGAKWRFNTFSFSHNINTTISSINSTVHSISKIDTIKSYSNNCIEFILSPDIKIFYNKFDKIYEKNTDNELISLKNEYQIEADYSDIKIYGKENSSYIIIGFYSDNFHKSSELRLIEGLQLITGYRIRPYLIYKQISENVSVTINSSEYKNEDTFLSPLNIRKEPVKDSQYPWDIFSLYYKSVSNNTQNRFSPIGSIINSLVASSGAFFETQILVLCVRIEGMLEFLFPDEAKPDNNTKKQVCALSQYISNWDGDNNIAKRAIKNIENMKSARAKDKLISLREKGVVNKKQFDSWNGLRNASAHSKIGINKDYDFTEIRKKYDAIIEMFYRILFYYIGYKGKYTEYSSSYLNNVEMTLYKNKA